MLWHKLLEPEGERFLLEMQECMQDIVNKKDELDANEMWQVFKDCCTARAKEILGISKGKLNIGKESWFWKGEAIKEAVAAKKAAFKSWSECDSTSVDEIELLRKLKNETKKAAAKEVAKAKAVESQKLYEDLESPEGSGSIFKRKGETTANQ